MKTNRKIARKAGLLYLIYIVIHVLANVIGRIGIINYGDAATTARNILASAWQFRIGFVLDLLAAVLFLFTAWALYVCLMPVHKHQALLFLLLNLCGVVVQCVSGLLLYAGQLLLGGSDYLNVFSASQIQALVMAFLTLYKNGFTIAQIFFGAWLFPLGYTIFRSGFLPKFLGIVFMVHCCTWLMTALGFFLFPDFKLITYVSYPLGFVAEFGLSLWLLVMPIKERPQVVAGQSGEG